MKPRVTIFIPVFNGEPFLAEAIRSILVQSFSDFELLIIDDGSTDGSQTIVESFFDDRIRFLRNDINRGISFTRNRAIKEARGDYLAFLDADDIALPERLGTQVNYLDSNPQVVACGSQAMIIDDNGNETGESLRVPVDTNVIKCLLAFRNVFINSTMMIRLEVLKSTKGYYDGLCEDYEIAVQLNRNHKLANIDEVLVKYRWHGNNTSAVFYQEIQKGERWVLALVQQQLGIEENRELVKIHHSVFYRGDDILNPIHDYLKLFLTLKSANYQKGVYPKWHFDKLLFTLWYDKTRELAGRKAVFAFFNKSLFHAEAVSFKMIRKVVKQSFWFRKKR